MVLPTRMFLVFSACIVGLFHVEATADTLSSQDSSFCHGGLQVNYPELFIDKCLIIPKANNLQEKISKTWKAPKICFPGAQKNTQYVLVMVDPDAPSRANPTSAFWRHWVVVDIQGNELKNGEAQGTSLDEYRPPTPPQNSGYHRYQFMLFEQPSGTRVSLTEKEKSSRGKWDLWDFTARFDLGEPVATLQFLTQNSKN
ncbi:hypothetical protein Q5P01_014664 [Channa striata]|uniref:Phosphatidylethanolamine-binding protein 4 n=1 Tax=Channa striata TaxID=64152 RepID=A0AA88MJ33_CHASR|nr:hypothetical protein Q5P01_014664 [Channa striata]